MSQNATPTDTPLRPDQLTVIESLVAGKSITAAAKQAGIRRETVHRWMREDYEFQAALHRLRRELLESVGAQVLATSRRAAETVDKAVAGGDVKTALQVLRGTGMLSGDRARAGSDDPSRLRDDAESAAEQDRRRRIMRRDGI